MAKGTEMTMQLPLPGGEGYIELHDRSAIAIMNMLRVKGLSNYVEGLESSKNKLKDQLAFVKALGNSTGNDLKSAFLVLDTVDARAKANPSVLSAVKEALSSVKAALVKEASASPMESSMRQAKPKTVTLARAYSDGTVRLHSTAKYLGR